LSCVRVLPTLALDARSPSKRSKDMTTRRILAAVLFTAVTMPVFSTATDPVDVPIQAKEAKKGQVKPPQKFAPKVAKAAAAPLPVPQEVNTERRKAGMDNLQKFLDIARSMNGPSLSPPPPPPPPPGAPATKKDERRPPGARSM